MLHKNSTTGEQHIIHNWEYANQAERLAATGFVYVDLKKVAYQLDDHTFWVLTSTTPPTWVAMGGGANGGLISGRDVAGATTLSIADAGKLLNSTSAAAYNISVPNDTDVAWAGLGVVAKILVYISAAGIPTFVAGDVTVTIKPGSNVPTPAQDGFVGLVRVAANTWVNI